MYRAKRATLAVGALLAVWAWGCSRGQAETEPDAPVARLSDSFDGPRLDPLTWSITRQNDFQESVVEAVDGRLRLRAATIGTRDDTVKYEGVRSIHPVLLKPPTQVSVVLDWNGQKNGCYLTAGLVLCPTATDGNPEDESDWLKVEYVGVPPGKNGRAWLSERRQGGPERSLYDEGWPATQRTGRAIGRQEVTLTWSEGKLTFAEQGQQLWQGRWAAWDAPSAYLYLQLSSHSNYPPREIFFDDVLVGPGA